MNWDQVKGDWKRMSGSIKQRWGDMTDDDLTEAQGDRDKFEGKIQSRYGRAKEDVRREVDDWLASHRDR